MHEYLLIDSGGPRAGAECDRFVGDAVRLLEGGDAVALLLIENAAPAAVRDAFPSIDGFLRNGGELWVDSFSLQQRAVRAEDLVSGARVVEMADVAEKLLETGLRAVWH
ncbi:hypothetical protein AB0I53_02650 [Saccharopolyspora sp. NPDC050389]|uniref:hypothetical protein n=1 Tax=Saccharopolyspora sp. NPDC050389 TaxID=3155516 RepID=UPI00340627E3